MSQRKKNWIRKTGVVALSTLMACAAVPNDDSGDRAFVAWATVALLGRRPYSSQELDVLSAISTTEGRAAVVELLMAEPDFESYWQSILMEDFRVALEDPTGGPTAFFPQRPNSACYTEELLDPMYDGLLLNHLSTSPPDAPLDLFGVATLEFTMADVFRAALGKDRLDALYVGHFGPFIYQSRDNGVNQIRFMDAYLDRDQACLGCHGAEYSTSNARPLNGNWDRYFPEVEVDLESQAFSVHDFNGDFQHYSGVESTYLENLFLEDLRAEEGDDHVSLFGIDEERCLTLVDSNGQTFVGVRPEYTLPAGWMAGIAGESGPSLTWVDLTAKIQDGITTWSPAAPTCQVMPGPDMSPDIAAPDCRDEEVQLPQPDIALEVFCAGETCHGDSPDAPFIHDVTRTMSTNRMMKIMLEGSPSGAMPPVPGVNEALAKTIATYLATFPDYEGDIQYENPNHALGHLVARRVADTVYRRITGASLTLDHGYSRNHKSGELLALLTHELVDQNWSLKALLREIVLSKGANRQSPHASAHDDYVLPMIANPWAATSAGVLDSVTGENTNGLGDFVHRWPVASLVRQRNTALLWPESTYWDGALTKGRMGHYRQFGQEGFDGVQIDAFLAWEQDNDLCARPADVDADFIDYVAASAISYEDAFRAIKGRLISDDRLWSVDGEGERALLASHFKIDVEKEVASDEPLRAYCAAVLASPQFMLAGLPAWDLGEDVPDAPWVECPDEPCTYQDFCEHYSESGVANGVFGSYPCP